MASSSSADSTSGRHTAFEEQSRPLIRIGDEMAYSMGVDADKLRPNGEPAETETCCLGLLEVRTAACLIALFEFILITYHIVVAALNYDRSGDDYAFTFASSLFSLSLALIAVLLLLIGVKRLSAFFLVPHLLMQFTVIVAWTLLAGYVVLLLLGGTSVKAAVLIYENTKPKEIGPPQLAQRPFVKASVESPQLNLILAVLFVLVALAILFQAWCFRVVRRCFLLLRKLSLEKSTRSNSLVAIPLPNSDKNRV